MKPQLAFTELPTLEEAKKLVSFIKKPLNGQVVLLGIVAPAVTTEGIKVGEAFQKEAQKDANRNGVMVVQSPNLDNTGIEEGDLVLYRPETPATFSRVVFTKEKYKDLKLKEGVEFTDEMYKRFVVIVVSVHDLTLVLNKKIE